MLCLCSYDCGAEGAVGDEEDGLKWAARAERRFRAEDILMPLRGKGCKLFSKEEQLLELAYVKLHKD